MATMEDRYAAAIELEGAEAVKALRDLLNTGERSVICSSISYSTLDVKDDGGLRTKENAVYRLGELYAKHGQAEVLELHDDQAVIANDHRQELLKLLDEVKPFFSNLPKARTARVGTFGPCLSGRGN